MLSNEKWFGASAGFYPETIDQSLRFDGSSSYLTKTPSSDGNRRKWTFSAWIKLSEIGDLPSIFGKTRTGNNREGFAIGSLQTLQYQLRVGSTNKALVESEMVLRDTTNWYHIMMIWDSDNATVSQRIIFYVNGQNAPYTTTVTPVQNTDSYINSTNQNYIGWTTGGSNYFHGYMAEVNFIDGQALDPSSFGETKNGVWIPKEYSGSYGGNGFRLTFADSSSLGDDTSGNGNDYTSSGLASTDVVLDSPTNNFCTLDPNFRAVTANTLSEGNLKCVTSTSGRSFNAGSFLMTPNSGKWYWEFRPDANSGGMGVAKVNGTLGANQSVTSTSTSAGTTDYYYGETNWVMYGDGIVHNATYVGGTGSGMGSPSYPQIWGIGIDMDASPPTISYYIDGSSVGSADLDTGYDYIPIVGDGSGGVSRTLNINFGQNPTFNGTESAGTNTDGNGNGLFHDAVPTNHLALCSSNLPDTTISPNQDTQADDHFDTIIYDGSASNQVITTNFQADWLWFKERTTTGIEHNLFDSSRGHSSSGAKFGRKLESNTTDAEADSTSIVSTSGNDITLLGGVSTVNDTSGRKYVMWHWKAGGTTPTKTYKVKVVADSTDYGHGSGANKYQFFKSDGTTGFGTNGVDLDLQEGGTYVFDWSDSTAQGHPLRFSLTNNGTHGGGSEYTTGVVKDDSAYKTTITVASGVANLYYYCQLHSGMGAEVRTNTTHGSTNFDGSILSVSQTNETSGFSIVTYTGTGTNGETVGHGLGLAPSVCIIKSRTNSGYEWAYWHKDLTSGAKLYWNSTSVEITGQSMFNNSSGTHTIPTSTLLTLSGSSVSNYALVNNSGSNHLAYVFAEIEGYSKFGSYTGNGSTDGTFVFTGFRPAWVMIKRTGTSGTSGWSIFDNKRNTFNPVDTILQANTSGADGTSYPVDFLSNGFKIRDSGSTHNQSGKTHIYMAFGDGNTAKFGNSR